MNLRSSWLHKISQMKWNVKVLDECNESICVNYNEKWWKDFFAFGLVFITIQASRLADMAEPKHGFRPCTPRVPPCLTVKDLGNLSISSNVKSCLYKSTHYGLSKILSKCVRDLYGKSTTRFSKLSINAHDVSYDVILHFLFLVIWKCYV